MGTVVNMREYKLPKWPPGLDAEKLTQGTIMFLEKLRRENPPAFAQMVLEFAEAQAEQARQEKAKADAEAEHIAKTAAECKAALEKHRQAAWWWHHLQPRLQALKPGESFAQANDAAEAAADREIVQHDQWPPGTSADMYSVEPVADHQDAGSDGSFLRQLMSGNSE